MHKRIADVMSQGILSIRSLEEMTNHQFLAQDSFSLKQTIAQIENFLLLFNPYTKYDLCRYWQVLEGKGYDPVVEYNKGLELFDMHYSPKPEDLFTIILQISRFLKEFSDFETKNTPQFRHPFIKGKIIEKKKTGQLDEEFSWFENRELLDDIVDPNTNTNKNKFQGKVSKIGENQDQIFDVFAFLNANSREVNQLVLMQENGSSGDQKLPFKNDYILEDELEKKRKMLAEENNKLSFLDDIGLEDEIKIMKMTEEQTSYTLQEHENYNVDFPSGKVIFKKNKNFDLILGKIL